MDNGLGLQGGMLQRLPLGATSDVMVSVLNDIVDRLNAQIKTQIFSDGANKRMLIGYQKDGWGVGKDFGIKVSMPNVDVNSATASQLLFKMDLETWFYYDPDTQKNFMQIGILPDGSGGWAVADIGHDVSEGF